MSLERVTRVSEALYRVTDLMPDEEPLKWTLRTKAIQLVELLSDVQGSTSLKQRADTTVRVQELISAIQRLLDIAAGASFISRVNFDVLQREYGLLRDIPTRDELLLFPMPAPQDTEQATVEKTRVQQGVVEQSDVHVADIGERTPPRASVSTTPAPRVSAPQKPRETVQARPVPEKGSARSGRILSYLGAHPWASRGDVAAIFGREISEKTLQRELSSLVESGAIIKEGEKRWCRYALKGQK